MLLNKAIIYFRYHANNLCEFSKCMLGSSAAESYFATSEAVKDGFIYHAASVILDF